MARKKRIHYPGAFYHVMLRGNAKQDIFLGKRDVTRFEEILSQGLERYDIRLSAYCWMANHVHMALQVSDTPLAKMMQVLSQRYTGWFNHRYDRVGHLFQGRYRAILVDEQGYLREIVRYIHLNPVRAGIVSDPAEYAQSSHRAYLDPMEKTASWLSIDSVLRLFGTAREEALARYRHFMGRPVEDDHLELLRKGGSHGDILGDDDFVRKIEAGEQTAGPRTAIPRDISLDDLTEQVAKKFQVTPDNIRSRARNRNITHARAAFAMTAVDHTCHTLKDVAAYLGREVSTLSRQITALRTKK